MSTSNLMRIFSGEKIILSRQLNLMGLQVLRTLGARLIHRSHGIKDLSGIRDVPSIENRLRLLELDGMALWPKFLPSDQFSALRDECYGLARQHQSSYARKSGPNCDARVLASSLDLRTSALGRFLNDTRLKALLEGAERRRLGDLVRYAKVEHLTQGEDTGERDPQTELHSDIFFTSHKAWFYLTDVTLASGPLTFVKGSHLLSVDRLRQVYRHSAAMRPGDEPSRRVRPEELAHLPDETVVVCPANTLVLANTCGYHRRRQGLAGEERCSIHLEVRCNPFLLGKRRHVA